MTPIKKLLDETEKIEEKDIIEDEKDPSLLLLEIDKQVTKLEKIKHKLAETDEEKLERIKNLLKGK